MSTDLPRRHGRQGSSSIAGMQVHAGAWKVGVVRIVLSRIKYDQYRFGRVLQAAERGIDCTA